MTYRVSKGNADMTLATTVKRRGNEGFDNAVDNDLTNFFVCSRNNTETHLFNSCNHTLLHTFIQLLKFTYNCVSFLQ